MRWRMPVRRRQLGILGGQLPGQLDDHPALLDRGVVLHLPVEQHRAGAVAHRLDHPLGVGDVGRVRAEHPPGDVDLARVQAPGADAAEEVGVAELVLAGDGVGDVAERPVVRQHAVRHAGVDHAGDRVVPQVLLVGGPRHVGVLGVRILAHEVPRMAAADPGRLHPPVGGEVGRPERQALHPRRGGADLLHVGHTAGGLQDGVDEDRAIQAGLGLQLGQQPVDVVDILGPLDLGDHDHVEGVADLGDGGDDVVEPPRRVERVDPRPELGVAVAPRLADLDQAGPRRLLLGRRDGILEVGQQDVDGRRDRRHLGHHLRVLRRQEVDHPRRPHRDLPQRFGGADGQRPEEVLRGTHAAQVRERCPGPGNLERPDCWRAAPLGPTAAVGLPLRPLHRGHRPDLAAAARRAQRRVQRRRVLRAGGGRRDRP